MVKAKRCLTIEVVIMQCKQENDEIKGILFSQIPYSNMIKYDVHNEIFFKKKSQNEWVIRFFLKILNILFGWREKWRNEDGGRENRMKWQFSSVWFNKENKEKEQKTNGAHLESFLLHGDEKTWKGWAKIQKYNYTLNNEKKYR